MRDRLWTAAIVMVCAGASFLAGCSRSPRATFYTLSAGAVSEAATSTRVPYAITVGPATLPEVVDRPQLVVRVGVNRVEILENHRWAEPLKSEIPRLLADNLARLLGSSEVSAYPQNAAKAAKYTVLVDIQRFESVPGKAVTIEALWSVRSAAATFATTGHSTATEPVSGSGYEAVVAAHSRALAAISGDIANALRSERTAEGRAGAVEKEAR